MSGSCVALAHCLDTLGHLHDVSDVVGIPRAQLLGHRSVKDFERHQAIGFAPPRTPCGPDEKVLRDRILETLRRRDRGEPVAASRRDLAALVIAAVAEFGCDASGAGERGISAEWARRALATFARAEATWNRRERGRWWSALHAHLHREATDTANYSCRGPKLGSRSTVARIRRLAEDWQRVSPVDAADAIFPLAALVEMTDLDVEHGAVIEALPAVGAGLSAMAPDVLECPGSVYAVALVLERVVTGSALAEDIDVELPSLTDDRAMIGGYFAEYITERYLRARGAIDTTLVRLILPIVVYVALPSDPGWLRALAPAPSYLVGVPSVR